MQYSKRTKRIEICRHRERIENRKNEDGLTYIIEKQLEFKD